MKSKINLFRTIFIFSIVFALKANGQISISNISEIPKIKNGTLYVAMKDPNSEKSKEFAAIFKESWTFSKIECIKYSEIEKHISPTSSFLTIGGYETSVQSKTLYNNFGTKSSSGINWSNTHIFMELWTCSEKYFKNTKTDKEFKDKDKIQVARVELFTDFITLMRPNNLYQTEYDADGHIRNWGTGILKNYCQLLTTLLNNNVEQKLYSETYNKQELKNLNKEVLYVPDYVLTKFNKFTGDETKKHDEKDIFEDYSLNHKLLTINELSDKILNEKEAFYYLVYIKSSTDKFVSVINSATGEMIYSVYTPASYNIKSDDLKDLQKKISKS